jgi:hypothetical protein
MKNKGNFKAKPLNKKMFKQVLGVPRVEKMPTTTEFKEFKLRTSSIKPKEVENYE